VVDVLAAVHRLEAERIAADAAIAAAARDPGVRVHLEADSDDDADKKTIQDRVFEHLHQAVPRNRCVCERDCNAAAVHSCHARARAA
jgi:hypothetical protein